MITPAQLQPGDVLLYEPSSFFGYAIAWLTGGWVSHVEVYRGNDCSYASRDGLGVSIYAYRADGLTEVRRSQKPIDLIALEREFLKRNGDRYDYNTIVKFLTFGKCGGRNQAEVCSELATLLLRAGGVPELFGDAAADEISPRDFQKEPLLEKVWSSGR